MMLGFFLLPLAPLLQTFAAGCSKPTFFGLVPWYQYLQLGPQPNCDVQGLNVLGAKSSFLLIGLAVLDDLLRIAALAAVGFVIYGGIQYVTSQGSPDDTRKAKDTLINALVGLVLALLATSMVTFIGTHLE